MSNNEYQVNKITSRTLVPISLVVSLLGGSGWLTKQYIISEANAKSIVEIKSRMESKEEIESKKWDELHAELKNISTQLGRIQGILQSKQ